MQLIWGLPPLHYQTAIDLLRNQQKNLAVSNVRRVELERLRRLAELQIVLANDACTFDQAF